MLRGNTLRREIHKRECGPVKRTETHGLRLHQNAFAEGTARTDLREEDAWAGVQRQ